MQDAWRDEAFENVVVAVVGGTIGVGPAVAKAFAEAGAQVIVGVDPEAGKSLPGLEHLVVTNPEEFLDTCERLHGPVQVLVMVPPPVKTMNALDVAPSLMRNIVEKELVLPSLLIQGCARRMMARGQGGRVISFVSMSAKTGVHPRVASYAAAKGGLLAYSRSLAAELAPHGITVNAIATALFDAQVADKTLEERVKLEAGIPVGRVGRSEEAAHAALFLASRNAGYITGETLNLSGGRFMD